MSQCPCCGYCPACGRSGYGFRPVYYPYYPYYHHPIIGPTWMVGDSPFQTTGGTQQQQNIQGTFGNAIGGLTDSGALGGISGLNQQV